VNEADEAAERDGDEELVLAEARKPPCTGIEK
jgi:hypothetical protein